MKALKVLGLVLLVAIVVTACGTPAPAPQSSSSAASSQAPAAGKTIKIATQSPLSGGSAAVGEGIKNGAQLAIEQLSGPLKDMGFTVQLVPFDDQAKPEVGVANAKNIAADPDILGVVGHYNSGVQIPSSEEYHNAQLVNVSPANTNPKVTDRLLKEVNRVCGRDDIQGVVGEQFALTEMKVKSVYILHDKTTYGQSIAEFFRKQAEKDGIKVLGFEGTEEKANFDPILTPIQAANPDLIYFGGIFDQAGILFKQARDKGIKAQFMGPDGLDSADLAKIAGSAIQNMYYTTVAGPVTYYPEAKKFATDYKARFGKDPEPFAAQAYDSAAIILKGIETAAKAANNAKPTRAAVRDAVRATKDFKGITGSITFDSKGDPAVARYFVIQVVSSDPAKWGDNKSVKVLDIPAPPPPTQ
jgi:branched-chain amino acid transport system substrate-binding protein